MSDFESTRRAMQKMVREAKEISLEEFQQMMEKHQLFINSGGGGGRWETLYMSNLIFGVYRGSKEKEGEQASISFRNFTQLHLKAAHITYANLVGNFWSEMDLEGVDFEGSLFIDSFFKNCNFENANLKSCDFSRSDMRHCNFKGANLIDTDFERCDLTGADFRGAKIDVTTKFKDAILDGILQ